MQPSLPCWTQPARSSCLPLHELPAVSGEYTEAGALLDLPACRHIHILCDVACTGDPHMPKLNRMHAYMLSHLLGGGHERGCGRGSARALAGRRALGGGNASSGCVASS